ncbi:MAG: site-specific integrase [Candidatus Dormiibacterota bacterium]
MPQAPVRPRRKSGDWKTVPLPRPSMGTTWDDAVGAFLRAARARNCSPATLTGYSGYLTGPRARQFVKDYRIESVADITPETLRSFQMELLDAGLSAGTAATFHRIVRNFLGFCRREGFGVPEESLGIPAPLQPVIAPEIFSDTDERELLEACRCERDKMLIEFMMRTGLRRSEVLNVRVDDIVEGNDGAYVRVRQGKGRKDRIVPLDTAHDRFSRKLLRYVRTSRPQDAGDPHLWLSTRRNAHSGTYTPFDVRGLTSMLQRLSEATGIHAHPHKFRHTFASRALAAGIDSLVLQRALGHTTLAMVNRYVHFQSSDMLRAWQARSD